MSDMALRKWLGRRVIAVPVAAALAMAVIVFVMWQLVVNDQTRQRNAETSRNAERFIARLEAHVATRLAVAEQIRDQWASGNIANYGEFATQTNTAHELFRDFQAINWVDQAGIIRWVTPLKENEAALGLNIRKLTVPAATLAQAERSGMMRVTPPINLAQKGVGFVAYIPLKKSGLPDGFLNIVFRTAPLIQRAFPEGIDQNYHMHISDEDNLVFDSENMTGKHPNQIRRKIKVGNRIWHLSLMPTHAMANSGSEIIDEILLVFGLLISAAIAFSFRLAMVRQLSLRENEARFKDFSESTSDWFWEMNENLRFTFFSGRNQEITGFDPAIFVGKTRREIAKEHTTDIKWRQHLNDLDNHRPFRSFSYKLPRNDGSRITVAISGKPIFDRSSKFLGYRGTGIDITAQRQAEEARDEAWREAEQANRAKSEFLATMSHELRTPLNAISGFSEMLINQVFGKLGSSKYKEYAEDIHASSEHLLNLINDILDLTAIEAGKLPLTKESMNVENVIKDCSTIIALAADQKDMKYSIDVSEGLPPLLADRRAVKQILLNVLSNAVKFTPEHGQVSLKATTTNGNHVFTISDTGEGVPDDKLPGLTDPFVRTESDPLQPQEGTGLGLAIVKSLVDLHNGELTIESVVGEGTAVTVYLPSAAP